MCKLWLFWHIIDKSERNIPLNLEMMMHYTWKFILLVKLSLAAEVCQEWNGMYL